MEQLLWMYSKQTWSTYFLQWNLGDNMNSGTLQESSNKSIYSEYYTQSHVRNSSEIELEADCF